MTETRPPPAAGPGSSASPEASAEASAHLDAATLAHWQSWVGRSEVAHDEIGAAPLRGLSATLDRDDPAPIAGTPVPPLGHWLYFLPQARQSELGADGHPRRGGFLPPVSLPRRMWAGGRLRWNAANPLRVGDVATRHSRIDAVRHKRGRSGDLVFVTVVHVVHNAQGPCLTEAHDIVYRSASRAAPAAAPAGDAARAPDGTALPVALWQRSLRPDDVLLFRYSALTFNGHRIHYDRRYVTEVEGYPGLIVHGPLIATLLLDLLRRHAGGAGEVPATDFDYRFLRPSFDGQPLQLMGAPSADGRSAQLWALNAQGELAMHGHARLP